MTLSALSARGLAAPQIDPARWPQTRRAWLEQILSMEYGPIPEKPSILSWDQKGPDLPVDGGVEKRFVLSGEQIHLGGGRFSFPLKVFLPDKPGKAPFFVYLSFKETDEEIPLKTILDRGFALIQVWYEGVTCDNGDFSQGCAPVAGRREAHSAGKLAIWAWAAMRALDFAQSLPQLDLTRAAVLGHSRLGKAALLAGAVDERFALVAANNSGCGGAAPYRKKAGETLSDITRRFPYWFCPDFSAYAGREEALPFDQHQLIAACAPRAVLVGSAQEDAWADPTAEYLGCVLAGKVYEQLGLPGFAAPDSLPACGCVLHEGRIGYHLRAGGHALTALDWNLYMDAFPG